MTDAQCPLNLCRGEGFLCPADAWGGPHGSWKPSDGTGPSAIPCPHVALSAAQEGADRLRERLETEVAFSMWLRPTDHWQILRDKFNRDDLCGCNEILRGMARTFLRGAPDPGHGDGGKP